MKVSVKIHKDRLHDLYPKDRLHDLYPKDRLHDLYPKDRLHDLYPKDRLHDLYPESVPSGCPDPGFGCCDLPTRGQISESRVKLDPGPEISIHSKHMEPSGGTGREISPSPHLSAEEYSWRGNGSRGGAAAQQTV
ncbi:unnamed protein product [Boreogadus saida]